MFAFLGILSEFCLIWHFIEDGVLDLHSEPVVLKRNIFKRKSQHGNLSLSILLPLLKLTRVPFTVLTADREPSSNYGGPSTGFATSLRYNLPTVHTISDRLKPPSDSYRDITALPERHGSLG